MAPVIGSLPGEHVEWRYTKEQEARFTAKTCLIAAQGEQRDNAEYEIGFEDESDESDADTDGGLMIVDSGLPSLKRKFLDRLAEIFAREKLASLVSAAAMEECEGKIVIYVVRTEAMVKKDKRFCKTLKLCLQSISAKATLGPVERASILTTSIRFFIKLTQVSTLGTTTLLLQRSLTDSSI